MEVLKLIILILLGSMMIFIIALLFSNTLLSLKKKPKCVYPPPQEPGLGNVIDWDTMDFIRQNPSTAWTSWTTTVSSSGEVFIEKSPEENKTLKEHDRKDPVKLKSRFELLKE